ncbi:glycolipid transfer protein domain-containing protein 2 [Anguilla anguilla]|uniref:glycolipid transfer protein domain-containing protein 2 n=1 Tax=Anguilla anguilla TaxID=7936 RepID=UPI0015A911B1|nr:glycolipid transfer protein domain-containing protein 2 [Anguilla anguilla]XP_035289955.1 glycolipid transfer protein domain-containing protein 2 [Anguilla anguilla]XP_035289956.1 glycolipid transfer protein domain-containing protein 2 [Anguilla anguilla]
MVTMGIKTKAAVAIVILLVFLGSMWLQGGLENQWRSCMKGFPQDQEPVIVTILNDTGTDSERDTDRVPLGKCPGQDFQVSRLLSYLLAAPAPPSDVLLQPYLSSWDELIKFMEALGPMVGIISQEIDGKTSIIRQLARNDAERQMERPQEEEVREGEEHIRANADGRRDWKVEERPGPQTAIAVKTEGKDAVGEERHFADFGESYLSVRSMIQVELRRGTVDFAEQTDSGCRTLLRLHRALLWLQLFLKKLGEKPAAGARLRSPSELCREAYQQTLAHHHSWLVRRAAELAFLALPDRGFFFRLVCVHNQDDLALVLNRVVRAIGEVYQRTQNALEEYSMLNLP